MKRVLFFTATTGYQARAFDDAAAALGIELVHATDHCARLGDLWGDGALSVKFAAVERSTRAVLNDVRGRSVDGVLAAGDEPAVLAAHVAAALGLDWHAPDAVETALDKVRARGVFLSAGLPVPWFVVFQPADGLDAIAPRLRFPCVVKPTRLSASRGVIRADTPAALDAALARLQKVLERPDVAGRHGSAGPVLIEGFVPGREYALEGLMDHGVLHVLAIFDKPDPLDGPFFEETIYVTPPILGEPAQRAMAGVVAHGALAMGLAHGPIHAECRMNDEGIFLLEVAARPIGGLCARALRFVAQDGETLSLEALLLRHAVGEPVDGCCREAQAAGVMMIPVPERGYFRTVDGEARARAVAGVEDVVITAKPGELLEPWPEGHSYPGFVFARAALPEQVSASLRAAHAELRFRVDRALPLA